MTLTKFIFLILLLGVTTVSRAEDQLPIVESPHRDVVDRAPIAFVPFELKDANGHVVPEDAVVDVQQPGGGEIRRIRAGDRLKSMNDTERFLNAHGYSLRDPSSIPKELYASGIDPQQVARQTTFVGENNVVFDPSFMVSPPSEDVMQTEHDAAVLKTTKPSMEGLMRLGRKSSSGSDGESSTVLQAPNGGSYNDGCASVGANEGCLRRQAPGFDFGRRDLAFVSQYTFMEMRGNLDHTSTDAQTGLEAGIINHPFKILHAQARLTGDEKKGDTIHVEATKLGRKVFGFDSHSRDGFFDELPDRLGLTRDPSNNTVPFIEENIQLFQTTVVIVVVPVTFRVGLRASGKVYWHTPTSFSHIGIKFGPRIGVGAYARAALGLDLEAGVEGEITVIEDSLGLNGHVQFRMSPSRGPFFEALALGENSLDALRGNVYAYARVPCGLSGSIWPPDIDIEMCEPKLRLFGWEPINLSKIAIFNERYVWWFGGDGVDGGSTSNDTVAAALIKEESQWDQLVKEENAFFPRLERFLGEWTPARIHERAEFLAVPVRAGVAEAVALAEKLRGDLDEPI